MKEVLPCFRGDSVPRNVDEGVRWFRKAAEGRNPAALYWLGAFYETGEVEGISRNLSEAAEWYRKAGAWSSVDAIVDLGKLYSEGRGIAKDQQEAVKLWQAAAEKGDARAHYELARVIVQVLKRHSNAYIHFAETIHGSPGRCALWQRV